MFALVQLKESETISVGEVTLHPSEDAAIEAGIEKYEAEGCEEDSYGRYVDPESGEAVFQVCPVAS